MTLPNPGVPLSLAQIKGEFGGPANNYGLANYYAGGAYVPTGTVGYYGPIPTAGNTISIRNFYGAAKANSLSIVKGLWSSGSIINIESAGYRAPPYNTAYGSISPGTYNGIVICATFYNNSPLSQFVFALVGSRAQSFFTSITPSGGPTLTTATAAYYSASTTLTEWRWNAAVSGWIGVGTVTAVIV